MNIVQMDHVGANLLIYTLDQPQRRAAAAQTMLIKEKALCSMKPFTTQSPYLYGLQLAWVFITSSMGYATLPSGGFGL